LREEKRRGELPAFVKAAAVAALRALVLDWLDGVHFGGWGGATSVLLGCGLF
jgi:hypothetical protein